ncbi:hypothetical protein AB0407_34760 [Streptomyces microflavus]|uniref:hypothetical protein n=1 Tax=Streptomyces microflavus TaxID=1919 RepID=UPI00343F6E6A
MVPPRTLAPLKCPLRHGRRHDGVGARQLEERRKTLPDAPEAGMVWEPGKEAWENKLAAFRSYQRATGHLAPQQDTVWGESETEGLVPIGAAPGQPPPEGRAGQGPGAGGTARGAAGRER